MVQREEARGYTIGSDINGQPIDPEWLDYSLRRHSFCLRLW
jgi:hypothetical protein